MINDGTGGTAVAPTASTYSFDAVPGLNKYSNLDGDYRRRDIRL